MNQLLFRFVKRLVHKFNYSPPTILHSTKSDSQSDNKVQVMLLLNLYSKYASVWKFMFHALPDKICLTMLFIGTTSVCVSLIQSCIAELPSNYHLRDIKKGLCFVSASSRWCMNVPSGMNNNCELNKNHSLCNWFLIHMIGNMKRDISKKIS